MTEPALSVVVPCYNEADGLVELHRRIAAACRQVTDDYEILLVNDGSKDETWPTMQRLRAEDSQVVAVNLSRNHGHQLALTAGLSLCRGGRILIIDADLQDPPELLADMMKLMDDGADVVYGQRRRRDGESRFKRWTAYGFYRLIEWLSDTPIPRDTGDFRLMSRRALDTLQAMPEQHRFIRGMVSWIGFKQVPMLYDREARFAGKTKYPFRKMFRFALDAITAFSIKPLALASLIGVVSGFGALLLIVYALISMVVGQTVPGWVSLMGVIALLGSVQLFVLGIIGEYLGRLYEQAKGRPLFIIESIEGGADEPDRPTGEQGVGQSR